MSASALDRAFEVAWASLKADVTRGALPSAVLAVATPDELVRAEAMTSSDLDYRVSPESVFLLASISKPIVATALLQLVETGKILLGEPIANHWPEFAVNHKECVTLWHLLTHTSGMDESYAERRSGIRAEEIRDAEAAAARDTFLSFPAGSQYRYCNAAFRVMTTLLERFTGQAYDTSIRESVLAPLGMHDSTFVPDFASKRVVPVVDFPYAMELWLALASPSGGYWSTAGDLIRFGQAWLKGGVGVNGRVLGRATVSAATRIQYAGEDPSQPVKPAPVARGLGWAVIDGACSELVPPGCYGHGAATGTRLLVDPSNGLVLVFLTNQWGMPTYARERAINAFYGALLD